MSDIVKIKEVNGTDIFFDRFEQRFFYWDNLKRKTSLNLDNLIRKLKSKK